MTTLAGDSQSDVQYTYLGTASQPVTTAGAQVGTADGNANLLIPAGALPSNQNVTLTELTASQLQDPIPSGDVLVGTAVDVNLGTGVILSAPGALTLNYNSSLVPSGDSVAICQDGAWTALTTTTDTNSVSATAGITASGDDYAVLAVPASSSGGGTVTSGGGGGGAAVVYRPTVQTEAASSVTATSAVLSGDITSDNGYDVSDYGFLWGTSAGSLTNKLDVGHR